MSTLCVKDLSVRIGKDTILCDVSFTARRTEMIGLIGPNGAGKSTLARSIAGLLPPASGAITVDGQSLAAMPKRQVARTIGYLSQGHDVHWPLSVETVVGLGRAPHLGALGTASEADKSAIENAMRKTDTLFMADRDVTRLSGGERSRVLLARALAVEAKILIADEPVGALDPLHALNIMALLQDEAAQGALVIVVIHDLSLAMRFCSRVIMLGNGQLSADGPPSQLLSSDGLVAHYGVTGHHGTHEQEDFVLPWRPA